MGNDLNRERHADELLGQYLDLETPAEQREFLDNLAAAPDDVRAEFHQLWAVAKEVDSQGRLAPDRMIGRTIGPYRITRLLGRGGFGVVYLADRNEHNVVGQVALKFLDPTKLSGKVRERFEIEKRALSALKDHEGIVEIISAGETDDGIPYLVMEYVDGDWIDRYCDEQQFDPRNRLKLFQMVCRAVAFAHGKQIVHRDLKPANILVDRMDRRPRVLDFGLAKFLSYTPVDATTTTDHDRAWTAAYASPEQVSGQSYPDSASDVYSLGVVLYELLTGSRPFSQTEVSDSELQHKPSDPDTSAKPPSSVVDGASETGRQAGSTKPSSRELAQRRKTTPRELVRFLRRGIDDIALKAIEKDPRNRYTSADGLALDIENFLQDLPLIAWEGKSRWRYRLHIWLRRYWKATAVAAVILVLQAAAILFSVGYGRGLEIQRNDLKSRLIEQQVETEKLLEQQRQQRIDSVRKFVESAEPYLAQQTTYDQAFPWLVAAIEAADDDDDLLWRPRMLLLNALRRSPTLEQAFFHNDPITDFSLDPKRSSLLMVGGITAKLVNLQGQSLGAFSHKTPTGVGRFLPNDDKLFVTTREGGFVTLWDVRRPGRHEYEWPAPHNGLEITGLSLCCEGRRLAVAYRGRGIPGNAVTPPVPPTLETDVEAVPPPVPPTLEADVESLADGKSLGGEGLQSLVVIYDLEQRGQLRRWNFTSPSFITDRHLSLNKSGTKLAVASGSDAFVLDVDNGSVLSFVQHDKAINTVEIGHHEHLLATGSDDQTLSIWEVATGIRKFAFPHSGAVRLAWFSDNDDHVFTGIHGHERIFGWELRQGSSLSSLLNIRPEPPSMATRFMTEDHRQWVLKNGTNTVCLFDVAGQIGANTAWFPGQLDLKQSGGLLADRQGDRIVAFGKGTPVSDNSTQLWSLSADAGISSLPTSVTAALTADGAWLYLADSRAIVPVSMESGNWDQQTKFTLVSEPDQERDDCSITHLAVSPAGEWLAAACADGVVRILDAKTGVLKKTLRHTAADLSILDLCFAGNDRYVSAVIHDHAPENESIALVVWDLETDKFFTKAKYSGGVLRDFKRAEFRRGGRAALIFFGESEVEYLDDLCGDNDPISPTDLRGSAADLSDDGRWLVTGLQDGSLGIWDLSPSQPVVRPTSPHMNAISIVRINRAADLVLGVDHDAVYVYHIESGKLISPALRHLSPVTAARFVGNDRIVTASFDKKSNLTTLHAWDISNDSSLTDRDLVSIGQFIANGRIDGGNLQPLSSQEHRKLWGAMSKAIHERLTPPRSAEFEHHHRQMRLAADLHNWKRVLYHANYFIENYAADADAHHRVGYALLQLGRYDEAQEAFARAAAAAPSEPLYPSAQVFCALQQRDWHGTVDLATNAIALLERKVAANQGVLKLSDYFGWEYRGVGLANLKRWKEAAEDFSRERQLNPTRRLLWRYEALCLLAAERIDDFRSLRRELMTDETFRKTDEEGFIEHVLAISLLAPFDDDRQGEEAMNRAKRLIAAERVNIPGVTMFVDSIARDGTAATRQHWMRRVQEAEQQGKVDTTPREWLVLAVAEHDLGNGSRAADLMRRTDERLAELEQEAADGDENATLWDVLLEYRLLQRKAEAAITAPPAELRVSDALFADYPTPDELRGLIGRLSQQVTDHPDDAQWWYSRGTARAQLALMDADAAEWSAAADDLAKAVELAPRNVHWWYYAALTRVAAGQAEQYQNLCRRMFARFNTSDRPDELRILSLTCGLASQSLVDVDLLRVLKWDTETKHGAVPKLMFIFRATHTKDEVYHSMVTLLSESLEQTHDDARRPFHLPLIALCRARVQDDVAARDWLDRSRAEADRLKNPHLKDSLPWYEQLLFRLLLAEAEALLSEMRTLP